jgi:hypothetical protein
MLSGWDRKAGPTGLRPVRKEKVSLDICRLPLPVNSWREV